MPRPLRPGACGARDRCGARAGRAVARTRDGERHPRRDGWGCAAGRCVRIARASAAGQRRPRVARARGGGGPFVARCLSCRGWLCGARARRPARSAGRDRRVGRLEARGAGRRGLSHRQEMGSGGGAVGASQVRGVQCGRVRTGHLQGSRAAHGRSVRDRRGDDHRRLRHGGHTGLRLHPGRISVGRGARVACHRRRARRGTARGQRRRTRLRVRHRTAPWCRRLHLW